MDFLFPKPEVKTRPRSALSECLVEHQHEFVLVSFLLGAYATIKVLLLQHDLDRRMGCEADHRRSRHEESHVHVQCHSDDDR